jgi:hypothetical protein
MNDKLEVDERDERNAVRILQCLAASTIKLAEVGKLIKELRQEVEKVIWEGQSKSRHLKRPVEDLQLSMRAAKYIPAKVKTIGDLCRHKGSEIDKTESKYLREIWDALRAMGLVLKPED